ncbi:MAG TPA: hypothetical protein VM434_12970 [Beijerinckiaceae bacterium]|nr:hypothetical protein [Beijerinckiaceae bacterium]
MSPQLARPEDPAAIRASLIAHLERRLRPAILADTVDLARLLAPLPTRRLVECLRADPAATADALAAALLPGDPDESLGFLARTEYPDLPALTQRRLAALARTMRRHVVEREAATEDGLVAEGYTRKEVRALGPRAAHLLAVLDGKVAPVASLPDEALSPGERLCAAGARALARLAEQAGAAGATGATGAMEAA